MPLKEAGKTRPRLLGRDVASRERGGAESPSRAGSGSWRRKRGPSDREWRKAKFSKRG